MLRYNFTVLGRIVAVLSVVGCVLAGAVLSAPAQAAGFPEKGKAIRVIVGYAAGGTTDVGARILASGLEKELGTPVVVGNVPGASGQIALTALTQAKPDGYTIGSVNFPGVLVQYLDPVWKAVYTRKSFQLLALHVIDPSLFAVKDDSPFKSLKDVIDAAKAAPKKVTITIGGIQGDDQFGILQLQRMTGAQFAMVTFSQGGASPLMSVLGGKIDVFCGNVGDVLSQFNSREMRILGIMDNEESAFYPGVKTFEAQGYKIYNASSRGYVAPQGTPKEVVDILSSAIKKVMSTDDHKKKMAAMGLPIRYMDPVHYSKYWDECEKLAAELMPLAKE